MKDTFIKSIVLIIGVAFFGSCSSEETVSTKIEGAGNIGIEFDNSFAGNDLVLGAANTPTWSNEVLKINNVKYIISNIVLVNQYGESFVNPKATGYFIVDEADATTHVLELTNVPAGNYVKIKFGIGVDQTQYNLGEDHQGDFLATAQAAGMIDDWGSGYKFLTMSGTFDAAGTSDNPFSIRTGKTAAAYNYKEVTLDLPGQALVRTTIAPEIHVVTNLSKLLDAVNPMKLSDNPNITDGADVAKVTENLVGVFSVAHVHND